MRGKPRFKTYCSQCNYLLRILNTHLLRDTLKVEDEGRENLPVMLLPLSYGIQVLFSCLVRLGDGLLGLLPDRNQFPFERGLLRGIGLSGKHTSFNRILVQLLTRRRSDCLVVLEHLL